MSNPDDEDVLRQQRRLLLDEFDQLPDGDVIDWQRRLHAEHLAAEAIRPASRYPQYRDHRRRLRLIADNLAWTLLPRHTLRNLSGGLAGPRPSLLDQVGSMELVWDTATRLMSFGFVPIIADLTNLIRIGDVVGWRHDTLVVVECKNQASTVEGKQTRQGRQRARGERFEDYLRSSSTRESDTAQRWAIAAPELPEPDWESVGNLLTECRGSSSGVARLDFAKDDYLFAGDLTRNGVPDLTVLAPSVPAVIPMILFFSDLMKEPSFVARPPSSYPLPVEDRQALLEGDISLGRLVDVVSLKGEFVWRGAQGRLVIDRTAAGARISAVARDHRCSFESPLVNYFLASPIPLTRMAEFLAEFSPTALELIAGGEDQDPTAFLASGDEIRYVTRYR